ncbi:TetR/AcrR family transcriptional regulator [Cohnella endophytica]|uniref:TetR/AcrR family transcriptional regulator n=1 Tax=Cohnella endophytica TaxID=2419778 RepID=A0A494XWQ5_9BACL|nr:TetR/AcrR family transcriptional regulator [Cohnella endophytica]RKP55037.1 TetR/AcrR family transcriptional regulator [Cohnella endophytica]
MEDETLGGLPRGVALSWGLIKEPQRGPKREMSIQKIVESAIGIADKDGLSAVSMNRVAASLGFTAMSLYRYIPGKDELLLLMQDAVCEIDLLTAHEITDWREGMREYVRKTVGVFQDHPWFGDIPISGVPMTPNNLGIIDWVLRTMRGLPLRDNEKMSFVLLLSSYARVYGMLQRDMNRAVQSGISPEAFGGIPFTSALKILVTADRYPDLQPVVMSGAYTDEGQNEEDVINDFEFGLERILDGIEQYVNRKK